MCCHLLCLIGKETSFTWGLPRGLLVLLHFIVSVVRACAALWPEDLQVYFSWCAIFLCLLFLLVLCPGL